MYEEGFGTRFEDGIGLSKQVLIRKRTGKKITYVCVGTHAGWELARSKMFSIERNLELKRPSRLDHLYTVLER